MNKSVFLALHLILLLNLPIVSISQDAKSDREYLIEQLEIKDSIMNYNYDRLIDKIDGIIIQYDTTKYDQKLEKLMINEETFIKSYGKKILNEKISGYYYKELKDEIVKDQEHFLKKIDKLSSLNYDINIRASMRALLSMQTRNKLMEIRIKELELIYELFQFHH